MTLGETGRAEPATSESGGAPGTGAGGDNGGTVPYRRPPPDVVAIVEAPPTPVVVMSPDGRRLLFGHFDAMPPIAQQAEPMLGLAGVRFRPRLNEWQRAYYFTQLQLLDVDSGRTWPIEVPAGARLGQPRFTTDGSAVAFTRTVDEGIELWVADVERGTSRRLLGPVLNDTIGGSFSWIADRRELLVRLIPADRGLPPERPRVPLGPVVEDTAGKAATNRTFQDLLKDAHDESLFDHYCTAQLARVDLEGRIRTQNEPGIFLDAIASPDGRYVLAERVKRPYSYSVPIARFARAVEVWNEDGSLATVHANLPLAEEVPIQGVPVGPRAIHWQPLLPATLSHVEALDGGDPRREAAARDEIFRWVGSPGTELEFAL